ncbi:MAG: sigma 54-interacting transcriptional regulator [Myxococcaceae bacterium]
MTPLAFHPGLDEAKLWLGLQALLERVGRQDGSVDGFLDALADVLGADRAMLVLTWDDGETVPMYGRREGRALSPQERVELSKTLVLDAERAGRCVTLSAFDGDGTESTQAFGILAAFAAPLDATALQVNARDGGAKTGVLYVDFRDPARLPSPRVAEFLGAAATLLSSVVTQSSRLEATREALRRERVKAESGQGVALEAFLASQALQPYERLVRAALRSDAPVLLTGESGTGKTLLAQLMAEASGRRPVVRATVGSADDLNTITSELFGHEKGSFSGAIARRPGLVEYADGGTLIFDELLNLPKTAQQLLLDFTQFGTYRPLGWARAEPKQSKVRLICATNGNLDGAVTEGRFRQDLYFRVAGHRIDLPPLRERRDEIPALARGFLERTAPERRWALSKDLERWLRDARHEWKGNFRQLEQVMRRAVDLALADSADADELGLAHVTELSGAPPPPPSPAPAAVNGAPSQDWASFTAERAKFEERERQLLREVLARNDGVVSKAARELGLPRTSLLSRLASLGLERG